MSIKKQNSITKFKSNNMLVLIIKEENISNFKLKKKLFYGYFHSKNKDHKLAYFNMLAFNIGSKKKKVQWHDVGLSLFYGHVKITIFKIIHNWLMIIIKLH
jgi:hypothetical protein